MCTKLRKLGLQTEIVYVMLRTKDFQVFTDKIVLPEATDSEFLINQYADKLFDKLYNPDIIYRSSGIYAEKLTEKSVAQLFLFEDKKTQKAQALSALWDKFENKYGRSCFCIGTMQDPQEESKKHGQNFFHSFELTKCQVKMDGKSKILTKRTAEQKVKRVSLSP